MFKLILKGKKGTIFLTAMILAFLMVLVSGGLFRMVNQDVFMVRHIKYSTQAAYLAEAGINESLHLLNEDFNNLSSLPTNKGLGDAGGTFTVTSSQSGQRILLTSTATVKAVSRTVTAEINNPTPAPLNYPLSTGDDVHIRTLAGGSVTIDDTVYVNDDAHFVAVAGATIDIDGDINAGGSISITGNVEYDSKHVGQLALLFPGFDFNFYEGIADTVLTGDQVWNGKTLNGKIYVNGSATFNGINTLNGVLITSPGNDINIYGKLTHNQLENYPALIAGDDVNIIGSWFDANSGILNSNGLVYAEDDIVLRRLHPCILNGEMLARDDFSLRDAFSNIQITFAHPGIPPGMTLPGGLPPSVAVISWNK